MQSPQRDQRIDGIPMRFANNRVAASRARLQYGHEAPLLQRPRTRAGRSKVHQSRNANTTRPKFTAVRGRARRGGYNFMAGFGRPRPEPTKKFEFKLDHDTPD